MSTAVYPNMSAAAQDPLQALLVKAAYWAETAAGAGPFPMGFYPNMSASAQDSVQVLAAKLAYWLEQVSGGGGGGSGTTNSALGGAAPPTDGSVTTFFVYDTDTGFLWYNSGTLAVPTWNNV